MKLGLRILAAVLTLFFLAWWWLGPWRPDWGIIEAQGAGTVVTITATDTNNLPVVPGTVSFQLVSPGGASPFVTATGLQIGSLPAPVQLNSNGVAVANLYDNTTLSPANTKWVFTACTPGTPPPLGTGPQCGSSAQVTISGAAQAVSVQVPSLTSRALISAYLVSNYTNATTIFTNVPGLSFPVAANTNYKVRCDLDYLTNNTTTGGLQIQWTGPASPTAVTYDAAIYNTPANVNSNVTQVFSGALSGGIPNSTTSAFIATTTMTLRNGVNAGTIQLQAAATGVGTITIIPGSCSLQQ